MDVMTRLEKGKTKVPHGRIAVQDARRPSVATGPPSTPARALPPRRAQTGVETFWEGACEERSCAERRDAYLSTVLLEDYIAAPSANQAHTHPPNPTTSHTQQHQEGNRKHTQRSYTESTPDSFSSLFSLLTAPPLPTPHKNESCSMPLLASESTAPHACTNPEHSSMYVEASNPPIKIKTKQGERLGKVEDRKDV
ncbi:hypothetical protein BDV95DRAFT_592052 [Massariosphaeria phaeospora]|uniref:Uncharacterized protein n=1 Tax=Massariosphaeria phaeospora TaxID=100035 RepID=A0A7C8IBI2_9PLEO|nr:hypothetical protein BDV95DRAFT_592052 [Massariosphaeria phaeospora]